MSVYDSWKEIANHNYATALQAFKAIHLMKDDGHNHERLRALKQVAEELDWRNHDSASCFKKMFQQFQQQVFDALSEMPYSSRSIG